MKENYIYPVIIKKEDDEFVSVRFPDFPDQMTEAENVDKAVVAAQEVIATCIMSNEDEGKNNPKPSEENGIVLDDDEKIIFVHIWMPYFRNRKKEVYVKKTLTIPSWLDILAKENNINFSAILVSGLKSELGIDRK